MELRFLGGAREVGRSSILAIHNKTRLLMDCGLKINPEPPQHPIIDSVSHLILSHSHLDHCGAIPMYYKKGAMPSYMNNVTFELSVLLLEDAMKVAKLNGYPPYYLKKDLERMEKNIELVEYDEDFTAGEIYCRLYDAGHIPGSSSVLAEADKSVFYTGDINMEETRLMKPAFLPKNVDCLITESTYSYKDRNERKDEERKFIESVEEALASNETALIPVFAVGRAQEILLLLENYADMMALDGMAKAATDIILRNGEYVKDISRLRKIAKKVRWVHNDHERAEAVKKYPIIVSTAGMLGGGPVVRYLNMIRKKENSKLIFTGFLVDDSPGRNLLKTGIYKNEDEHFTVKCKIEQYELSGHTDRSGLFEIIKKTNPEKVFCIHGDKCEDFAKEIQAMGIEAVAPELGQTIKI